MTQITEKVSLYDTDFYLWVEDAISRLKARDLNNLDIENLIEEMEGLANRDKRELRNRLKVLLTHILKRTYIDSVYDNPGWELTINEQRDELQNLLTQSPSLKRYFVEIFDETWQFTLSQVKQEYLKVQFPDVWQFSRDIEAILTKVFWQ